MLPGKAGIEISRLLRASSETKSIPIIMLTAKSEESDKILGLESGADDYITKPFSPKELVGKKVSVSAKFMERGKWTKTDTSKHNK